MKLVALVCGLSFAVSTLVGCAAPAEEATDATEADLSEGTGSPTGGVDPTVTSPVAWGCNFQDGRSAVFVQARVHSAYGTLALYADAQDPNGDFDALSTGGGQKALETTKVKFKQEGTSVSFTATEEEGTPIAMSVATDEKLRMGSRIYPMTARLPEVDALGGCWGVR